MPIVINMILTKLAVLNVKSMVSPPVNKYEISYHDETKKQKDDVSTDTPLR